MQKEKDNIDQLRKRLQDCEDYILRIAKPFDGYWDKATEEVIDDHLGTRQWILDEMFEKHATEAEVRRFEVVNERLLALTKQLNDYHRTLQDQMSAIHTLGGEPFELETTLLYSHNDEDPHLFTMEEDAFYGSRWNEMLWVIGENSRLDDICWCCGDHICNLDDGQTWAEGPLRIPQLDRLCVCHAVHALCTHMNYSIPDLLRMTTYAFNYQINTHVTPVPLEG
jgi:hypothetical protein